MLNVFCKIIRLRYYITIITIIYYDYGTVKGFIQFLIADMEFHIGKRVLNTIPYEIAKRTYVNFCKLLDLCINI